MTFRHLAFAVAQCFLGCLIWHCMEARTEAAADIAKTALWIFFLLFLVPLSRLSSANFIEALRLVRGKGGEVPA